MYEDAFLLIGTLAQNEEVIEKIEIIKKGFRVKFKTEKDWLLFPFTKEAIQDFYEYFEIKENEAKK